MKILVCPLDWGLGHASRCIPVIETLLIQGHRVAIGGSGRSLQLLQQEFPDLEAFAIRGFSPWYPKRGPVWQGLFRQLPAFLKSIYNDKHQLRELLKKQPFDVIISDNRYGLHSAATRNVLITHQINLAIPNSLRLLGGLVKVVNRYFLSHFHEVWIPDFSGGPSLGGNLSHGSPPSHARYVGPLSRMEAKNPETKEKGYDVVAVVSGAEPQRTLFEQLLVQHLAGYAGKSLILLGKPEAPDGPRVSGNITLMNHAASSTIANYLQQAKVVISRPGYSSIMDLGALGCKALMVPTPGQTEQEYLAKLHAQNGAISTMQQSGGDMLAKAEEALSLKGLFYLRDAELLAEACRKLSA